MTAAPTKSYRFASPDQWGVGLKDRMVLAGAAGGLSPVARWSARTRSVGPRNPLQVVGVAPDGLLLCRGAGIGTTPRAPVWLLRDGYADEGPVEIAGALATSWRLVADGDAVWAFSAGQVERFDRDTLSVDRVVGIRRLTGDEGSIDATILDIAGAACGGLWVLVGLVKGRLLVLLDRNGCVRSRTGLGCRLDKVAEVAGLDGGKSVALFSVAEQRIFIIASATGEVLFSPSAAQFGPHGPWRRITSDGEGRLGVLSLPDGHCADLSLGGAARDTDDPVRSGSRLAEAILFLDHHGDALQQAIRPAIDGPGPAPAVTDIAQSRDRIVLATTAGALVVGSSAATGAATNGGMTSLGAYLTPALTSLPGVEGEGWLRAEFCVSLSEGAVFTCRSAGTSDMRLAERVRALAADTSMTAATRLEMAWTLLADEGHVLPPKVFAGPLGADTQVEVPLYGLSKRMIWLRLDVEAPQSGPPPVIRELRVLYPEASLMAMLPTIFSATSDVQPSALRDLVGVIETTSQAIDARIAGIGALAQPETAPPEWLDRIAEWTDIPWHDALLPDAKRQLVLQAGNLIRSRGTRQGLQVLLDALLPDGAVAEITDTGADYRAMILGGGMRVGTSIPFLLAGQPSGTPRLGVGAILGRTRLLCGDAPNPLDALVPTLHVVIRAGPAVLQGLAPLLPAIIAQVVPALVRLRISWRLPGGADFLSADGDPLDDDGPGALGRNAQIGRTVVAGRSADSFNSLGREAGFTLS